jgi:hypothetical protein
MQILSFYENTNTFFLPRVERIKFPHILHLDDIETKDTQFNLSAVFLEPPWFAICCYMVSLLLCPRAWQLSLKDRVDAGLLR